MKPTCFLLAMVLSAPVMAATSAEEVEFASHGVTLRGSIIIPDAARAAVVFVHGSGRQARSLPLAQRFAREGIAALVYDKRGAGQSGDNDASIPADLSLEKLRALRKAGHAYDYALFSGLGHDNLERTFSYATAWINRLAAH